MYEPSLEPATIGPVLHDPSLPRLYAYHRALVDAERAGVGIVTSGGLAALLGQTITSTQIRKDLSLLGALGRRGHGYGVEGLVRRLARVLGLDRQWRIGIVGFGYLGHALARFLSAREERYSIAAIYDVAPDVVGQVWNGITVRNIADLETTLGPAGCTIGVVAVPTAVAQESAERLVRGGIEAIFNFAPIPLRVAGTVAVRNIDLAGEMSILTHYLGGR